jgi:hypothetical protein
MAGGNSDRRKAVAVALTSLAQAAGVGCPAEAAPTINKVARYETVMGLLSQSSGRSGLKFGASRLLPGAAERPRGTGCAAACGVGTWVKDALEIGHILHPAKAVAADHPPHACFTARL